MSHLVKRRVRGSVHHFNRPAQLAEPINIPSSIQGQVHLPAPLKIDVDGLKVMMGWITIALLLLVVLGGFSASNLRKLVEKPTTVEVKNTMRIPYGFTVPNTEKPGLLYRPQSSKQYNI